MQWIICFTPVNKIGQTTLSLAQGITQQMVEYYGSQSRLRFQVTAHNRSCEFCFNQPVHQTSSSSRQTRSWIFYHPGNVKVNIIHFLRFFNIFSVWYKCELSYCAMFHFIICRVWEGRTARWMGNLNALTHNKIHSFFIRTFSFRLRVNNLISLTILAWKCCIFF